ncbi:MAG: Transcriptional regulator, TetR family [Mycobacterium sp.]|nr:Transcriptional regulator, TetR family [Mycobacterium sp.]
MSTILTTTAAGVSVADMSSPGARPSYPEAARALLRDTLLDAARDLIRERGWADTTMAAVATAAGVSRQTLYKEFGSRKELAQAYILRDADLFLAAVERAVASHFDDPRAALAAAFDVFLSAAADDPLIKAIVSGEGGDGLLALVTTHGGPVLQRATERLAAFLAVGWPQVPLSEAQVLAECVVRLAISHAALPSGPADLTAAAVARVLGPYVDRLLTEASEGPPS